MHLYWVKWEKRKSDLEDFSEHCPPPSTVKCSCQGNSGTISVFSLKENERALLQFCLLLSSGSPANLPATFEGSDTYWEVYICIRPERTLSDEYAEMETEV